MSWFKNNTQDNIEIINNVCRRRNGKLEFESYYHYISGCAWIDAKSYASSFKDKEGFVNALIKYNLPEKIENLLIKEYKCYEKQKREKKREEKREREERKRLYKIKERKIKERLK